jgi:hypothetical protein
VARTAHGEATGPPFLCPRGFALNRLSCPVLGRTIDGFGVRSLQGCEIHPGDIDLRMRRIDCNRRRPIAAVPSGMPDFLRCCLSATKVCAKSITLKI